MTILEKIVAYKKEEVAQVKKEISAHALETSIYFDAPCLSLKHFLTHPDKSGIIAEFKRKSPSKGMINETEDVVEVTNGYVKGNVSGLSILTDEHFFGGGNEYLQSARLFNHIPILRKEFIIDDYQVLEAKAIGADVILLIAECLSKQEVIDLAKLAKGIGLEVLMEIHSEEQLEKCNPYIDIVGVNNRNLKTFKVDIQHSVDLFGKISNDFVKISESGISDPRTIVSLKKVGFQGFLIGENFMKSQNPEKACQSFIEAINELLASE